MMWDDPWKEIHEVTRRMEEMTRLTNPYGAIQKQVDQLAGAGISRISREVERLSGLDVHNAVTDSIARLDNSALTGALTANTDRFLTGVDDASLFNSRAADPALFQNQVADLVEESNRALTAPITALSELSETVRRWPDDLQLKLQETATTAQRALSDALRIELPDLGAAALREQMSDPTRNLTAPIQQQIAENQRILDEAVSALVDDTHQVNTLALSLSQVIDQLSTPAFSEVVNSAFKQAARTVNLPSKENREEDSELDAEAVEEAARILEEMAQSDKPRELLARKLQEWHQPKPQTGDTVASARARFLFLFLVRVLWLMLQLLGTIATLYPYAEKILTHPESKTSPAEIQKPSDASSYVQRITTKPVEIFTERRKSSTKLFDLEAGEVVLLLEERRGWSRIRWQTGRHDAEIEGWVSSDDLKPIQHYRHLPEGRGCSQ